MINTNYQNQFVKIGSRGIPQKYQVNYEKFALGISKNKTKTETVSTTVTDTTPSNINSIVSYLEKGDKNAINLLEDMGLNYTLTEYKKGYKINFEQNGNKYTVAFNGENTVFSDINNTVINKTNTENTVGTVNNNTNTDYQNNLDDLFTGIERLKTEKRFNEFKNSISSVSQNIDTLKEEPNADTESYDALKNNLSKMISDYESIHIEQNNLLDEKRNIQKDILNLTCPKVPSKSDFEITNILPDGQKETVIDEEKYSAAMEQYDKDIEEYRTKNNELTAKMDDVINKLNINDMKLDSLDNAKHDVTKDINYLYKLQNMVNNSNNDTLLQNQLKESQNYLSKIIQKNAENRDNKLNLISDLGTINSKDYTPSEYRDKLNEYNEQISQCQINAECNDADIEYVFYNANLISLINELNKNGTGSKAMDKIIVDSTNEYNQLIENKKHAISIAYDNIDLTKVPNLPKKGDFDSEEEYAEYMKIYEYQKNLYEKNQENSMLRIQNSLSEIEKINKNLAQIEKMLFGHVIA